MPDTIVIKVRRYNTTNGAGRYRASASHNGVRSTLVVKSDISLTSSDNYLRAAQTLAESIGAEHVQEVGKYGSHVYQAEVTQ